MKTGRIVFIMLSMVVLLSLTVAHLPPAANAADFNADGTDDLAVGIPLEDLDIDDVGVVSILFGSRSVGLSGLGDQLIDQEDTGLDPAEQDDYFGSELAVGDFNCDGVFDLAVSASYEDVGDPAIPDAGAVHVLYGAHPDGISPTGGEFWYQATYLHDSAEANDYFGQVLTAGDFDGNGCDDLAIGVPYEDLETPLPSHRDAGIVNVMYGTTHGLDDQFTQRWTQDILNLEGSADENDRLGWSLAAGDFNGDGREDLAIGVPYEGLASPTLDEFGVVHIVYGGGSGLGSGPLDIQLLIQRIGEGDDTVENMDRFGYSLAAGDFNGDGYKDLAVGIPYEDVGTKTDAGAVQIFYGSTTGMAVTRSVFLRWQDIHGGTTTAEDYFGKALAAGDFDGNLCDDLAISAPWSELGPSAMGMVQILYGQKTGLFTDSISGRISKLAQSWNLGGTAEPFDRLGEALVSGNFNRDGYADLVIGVPYEDDDNTDPQTLDSGAIHVVYGGPEGLTAAGSQYLYQGVNGITGVPEANDHYGEVLASIPVVYRTVFLPILQK